MGNVMVDVNHVSIRFIQNQEKVDNLKEYFIKLVTRKLKYDDFWALTDVNFQIEKGRDITVKLVGGDLVVTSGLGGYYPSDLVIGTIEEVQKDESGAASYAVIVPAADFDALSEVFIIKSFDIVT